MAYKQNAGGKRQAKTGGNLPGNLVNNDPKTPLSPREKTYKKEVVNVIKKAGQGGLKNTIPNIGTGLVHGWNSQGFDSEPSWGSEGGNKDLGKSIGAAITTAYKYATGDIPKGVTKKNKPKPVRAAQRTYLD
jgi:hypothetical protein